MGTYRKGPVLVDAEQFFSTQPLPRGACVNPDCGSALPHLHTIHEGQRVILGDGDWVIAEADGVHYYPCKPDVFAQTYEHAGSTVAVTISETLAGEIRSFALANPCEATFVRLLALAKRGWWIEWRLRVEPDFDPNWREKIRKIAEAAGISEPPADPATLRPI